jgi:hypothetical protein
MTAPWTGETACALQKAMRMSNERFAERLGIGVLTCAEWLDLGAPVIGNHERLRLAGTASIRLIDMPLYLLGEIVVSKGKVTGSVSVNRFVRYALTMDLLALD